MLVVSYSFTFDKMLVGSRIVGNGTWVVRILIIEKVRCNFELEMEGEDRSHG